MLIPATDGVGLAHLRELCWGGVVPGGAAEFPKEKGTKNNRHQLQGLK